MIESKISYQEELEDLTGKIFIGDLTPLVYDVLKDSKDITSLLQYLTGQDVDVNAEESVRQPEAAPNFDEWFKGCVEV